MDLSLDDIIQKKNLNSRAAKRGFGSNRRGGAARGGGGRPRGRGGFNAGRNTAGGGGVPSGKWNHDMFNGGGAARNGPGRYPPSLMGASAGPVKMLISNLDFNVSDSDIRELFREFGELQTAAVHYDSSGRSMGSAQVVFRQRSSAVRAKQQYNGVHLDGRPMNILIEGDNNRSQNGFGGGNPVKRLGAAPRGGGRGSFGGGSRGRGGARGGARGGRGGARSAGGNPKEKAKSAEELDAELDKYLEDAKKK